MGTKEKIIARISNVDDERYLRQILSLLNAVEDTEDVYQLSVAERKGVEEGLQDVAAGRVHSQEDVDALTARWLREK